MQNRSANHLWFHLAITSGFVLAIVLLVSSVTTYIAVSHRLVLERLRGDLHSQASTMEEQARRDGIQTRDELLQLLQRAVEKKQRPHRVGSRPQPRGRRSSNSWRARRLILFDAGCSCPHA